MRIGIDARFLTHPQRGGFKTYTENLIKGLLEIDSANDYILYLDRPPDPKTLKYQANVTYRIVNGIFPILGMPYREQIALRKQFKADRLDIIHFPCNTATFHPGLPYVITLHDTIQINPGINFKSVRNSVLLKRWAINAYSKLMILASARKASQIITVSEFERSHISRNLNIQLARISAIHLAPNPLFIPASQKDREIWCEEISKEIRVNNRFILGIGYESRKNIPLLIHAFQHIAPKHPDINLVLVVAEEYTRKTIFDQINHSPMKDRVIMLGASSSDRLVKLFNLAEIFVFPSERESFGLPPLEAIACGTATLAMNNSSLPEILQDGAMFIDGKDPEIWAKAIESVLTNEQLRADLRQKGYKRALQFSWDKCARGTLRVYQSVL